MSDHALNSFDVARTGWKAVPCTCGSKTCAIWSVTGLHPVFPRDIAHLIAASPKLLQSLRTALEYIKQDRSDLFDSMRTFGTDEIADRDDALALAVIDQKIADIEGVIAEAEGK